MNIIVCILSYCVVMFGVRPQFNLNNVVILNKNMGFFYSYVNVLYFILYSLANKVRGKWKIKHADAWVS